MDADKSDWDMLDLASARERCRELGASFRDALPTSTVTRQQAVEEGRWLAADVAPTFDSPDRDYATMDGYAFDATDDYPLTLVEEVLAGDDPGSIDAGEAVRIATGAPLPEGANAVLKVELAEETEESGGDLRGEAIDPGTYTYRRGSNFAAGETLLAAGTRLRARHAAILRDASIDDVETVVPPRAGILATGEEIASGEIEDLDSEVFAGYLAEWGLDSEQLGAVTDDPDLVRATLADACDRFDVVFTSGGTSVGKADHVVSALHDLGEVHFHAVRIRPGKPIAVATVEGSVVFAIPGKPIGALVAVETVVRPFFDPTPRPTVACEFGADLAIPREGFSYVVPVRLSDGVAWPLGREGGEGAAIYGETFNPSVLSSASRAATMDGYVVTDRGMERGESVDVRLF